MNPGGFDPDDLDNIDIDELREQMFWSNDTAAVSWDDDTPLIVSDDVYDVCESCT